MPDQIQVRGPDGQMFRFPANMAQEEITGVLDQHYGRSAQPEEPEYRSTIFPLSRMEGGDVRFDLGSGITGAIGRAIRAPGEAMRGELPVTGPDGRVTDEAIGRSLEFAGLFGSGVNPMVRSGDRAIPGPSRRLRRPDVPAPTREQLREAGSQQYRDFRATDAQYSIDDMRSLSSETRARLSQEGFSPDNAPQTFGILDRLDAIPSGGIVSPNEIQSVRQTLGRAARPNVNYASEPAAASAALSRFDEFVRTYDQSPSGTPAHRAASETLDEANANWGAMRRSEGLAQIDEAAELRAAAANSGQNLGNQIRQRVANALLRQNRPLRSFNGEELAELRQIIRGTFAQNATRDVGSLLGGGGGLGGVTAAGLGGAAGSMVAGAPGAFAGAVGTAAAGRLARSFSNRLTQRAFDRADEAVRRRSPLYQQMLRRTPLEGGSVADREAMVRILLALEFGGQEQQRQSLERGGFR